MAASQRFAPTKHARGVPTETCGSRRPGDEHVYRWTSASPWAGPPATKHRDHRTAGGNRLQTVRIQSHCWRSSQWAASLTSSRSATGGCWSHRLPSSAAVIMAADLATTPVSGVTVQLCGDAHASKLRAVRNSGTPDAVRHQRLRYDSACPLGVGREAPSCTQSQGW
jgi:hypothetical protein